MIIDNEGLLPVGGGQIDTVTDVLKDQVTYTAYTEEPNGPIDSTGKWRCAPQVSAQAVVNYYVDGRDAYGSPQTVDGFYVEPTHQGVHCTLYYAIEDNVANISEDDPGAHTTGSGADGIVTTRHVYGDGDALDDPLDVTASGSVSPSGVGLSFDRVQGSSLTIPAPVLRSASSWWMGLSFYASAGMERYRLAQFGPVVVTVDTVADTLTMAVLSSADQVTMQKVTFSTTSVNHVVFGFLNPLDASDIVGSGVGAFYLATDTQAIVSPCIDGLWNEPGNTMSLGDPQNPSGIILTDLVFKGEPLTTATAAGYMANPRPYCVKGTFKGQGQALTTNAYVRFDPTLSTPVNPYGFVGGTPDYMANLDWKPVVGDFILTKGNLSFPPLAASFWKFEMTNLVAEPYSVYLPQVPVTTQMHPDSNPSAGQASSIYQGAAPAGTNTQIAMAFGEQQFGRSATANPTIPDSRVISPTQTLVASSPGPSQALAGQFMNFGYMGWAQPNDAPVAVLGGQESYVETETSQIQQVAFFCGLSSLVALRTNFDAQIDQPYYRERFFDSKFVNTSGSGGTHSVSSLNALRVIGDTGSATSTVYRSFHDVEAVQFATAQTPPVPLIANDTFDDVGVYSGYDWRDITRFTKAGDATVAYDPFGHSAVVTRVPSQAVATNHSLIRSPLFPVMSETTSEGNILIGGGLLSPVVHPSAVGRCFAAARIVPVRPLSNPVYLMLLDATDTNLPVNERVLTQWPLNGGPGQRVETVQPFDIGEYAPAGTPLQLALFQEDESPNSWAVEGLSFYDEGIYWEFSCDGGSTWYPAMGIKNNAYGILSFPTPGNRLMWRATLTQPHMAVTDLIVRPVYAGDPFTARGYGSRGPTLEFTDVFASYLDDPLAQPSQAYLPGSPYTTGPQASQVGGVVGPIQVTSAPIPPIPVNSGVGIGLPLPVPAELTVT
jgi:hypothetical protein